MLLLTRKVSEEIMIGDDIRIIIVEIDEARGKVRLGIVAPKSVSVDRTEVREERLRREQEAKE